MGKGSKTTTQQTNTLDPEIKTRVFGATDSETGYANDVLGGTKKFSEMTPEMASFIGQTQNPSSVTGANFKSIADQFTNQPTLKFNGVGPATAQIGDYGATPVVTAQKGYQNMDPYMSKYTGSVIDAALGDLGAQRDKTQVQSNLAASAAGAAGGSRQGIRDSEVQNDYLRNVASTSANLRNQGFNTAAQLGMQDAGNALSADTTTAGMAAQRLASIFGAGNAASEANAGRAQQAGQFNAQGDFTAQGANADLRNKGLLGSQGALESGNQVDLRNLAMTGTGAQAAQGEADKNSPMEALKLKLAAAGILPTITNSTQTTQQKPGLFDWIGLGLSPFSK